MITCDRCLDGRHVRCMDRRTCACCGVDRPVAQKPDRVTRQIRVREQRRAVSAAPRAVSQAPGRKRGAVLRPDDRRLLRALPPEVLQQMRDLRAAGASYPEIGRAVGRHHTTVMYHLKREAAA